jgi:hypothetical protein
MVDREKDVQLAQDLSGPDTSGSNQGGRRFAPVFSRLEKSVSAVYSSLGLGADVGEVYGRSKNEAIRGFELGVDFLHAVRDRTDAHRFTGGDIPVRHGDDLIRTCFGAG